MTSASYFTGNTSCICCVTKCYFVFTNITFTLSFSGNRDPSVFQRFANVLFQFNYSGGAYIGVVCAMYRLLNGNFRLGWC